MATIRFLLGFVFLITFWRHDVPDGHLLRTDPIDVRQRLVNRASAEIGVREQSGRNDGPEIAAYLAYVGLKPGAPWCAAYVSWVYGQEGLTKPRSAWSPDLFPASRLSQSASPGNVLGIWFPELKRIAHVGLVTRQEGDWVLSVEGNTNLSGSREGDGVYRKRRHVRMIYRYADWVKGLEKDV